MDYQRKQAFIKTLTPGLPVVIASPMGWHGMRIEARSKVAKVLKTQVVLENGRRFTLSRLEEVGRSGSYSPYLIPADDPSIARQEREEVLRAAENEARNAVEAWMKGQTGRRSPSAIREVLKQMQSLLETVEKADADELAEEG